RRHERHGERACGSFWMASSDPVYYLRWNGVLRMKLEIAGHRGPALQNSKLAALNRPDAHAQTVPRLIAEAHAFVDAQPSPRTPGLQGRHDPDGAGLVAQQHRPIALVGRDFLIDEKFRYLLCVMHAKGAEAIAFAARTRE